MFFLRVTLQTCTSFLTSCGALFVLVGNVACGSDSGDPSQNAHPLEAKKNAAVTESGGRPVIVRKKKPPLSSSMSSSEHRPILLPGQPLSLITLLHQAPKKGGTEGKRTQLKVDVTDGKLLSVPYQGEPTVVGRIELDTQKREVRLFVDDKQTFRVRFQATGYLVYGETGQYRFSGRRTNLGWDLKRSSPDGTLVTELGRHVEGTLTTSRGAFSAIVRGESVVVGGPGLGRITVQGLSQEAASLFGVWDLSLEEKLTLAIFVHSLGREHRPSPASPPKKAAQKGSPH